MDKQAEKNTNIKPDACPFCGWPRVEVVPIRLDLALCDIGGGTAFICKSKFCAAVSVIICKDKVKATRIFNKRRPAKVLKQKSEQIQNRE